MTTGVIPAIIFSKLIKKRTKGQNLTFVLGKGEKVMVRQEVFGVVVLDNPVKYLDWKEHKIFHNCGGRVDLSKERAVSYFECGECRFSLSVSDAIGDIIRRMIAYVARTGEVIVKDLVDIDDDKFELQVAPIVPKGDEFGEAFREFLKTYRGF